MATCVLDGCWGFLGGRFCLGFFFFFLKLGLCIMWIQMLDVGPGSKFFETFCQNLKSEGTYWVTKEPVALLVHCPAQCKKWHLF